MPLLPAALLALESELQLATGLSRADEGGAGEAAVAEARQPDLLTSPRVARELLTAFMCSRARSKGGREDNLEVDALALAEDEAAVAVVVRDEADGVLVEALVVKLASPAGLAAEVVVVRLSGGGAGAALVVRVAAGCLGAAAGRVGF